MDGCRRGLRRLGPDHGRRRLLDRGPWALEAPRRGSGAGGRGPGCGCALGLALRRPGEGAPCRHVREGKTAADREAEAFLKKNRVLEDVAAYADEAIALPQDVPLRGRSCGTPNAFWSSETKDISYCYEFLNALEPVYQKQDTTGTEQ